MKKYVLSLLLIICIGAILAAGCTSTGSINANTQATTVPTPMAPTQTFSSSATEQTSVINQPKNNNDLSIGETATDGIQRFTVNSEQFADKLNTQNNIGQDKEPSQIGNQFLILDISIENPPSDSSTQTVTRSQFSMTDSYGYSYPCSQDTLYLDQGFTSELFISPGERVRKYFAFEVPMNPKGLKMTYTFSNGKNAVYSV